MYMPYYNYKFSIIISLSFSIQTFSFLVKHAEHKKVRQLLVKNMSAEQREKKKNNIMFFIYHLK